MAKLVIDANRKLSKINKEIQGQFSEHLGRCIYEGLYVGEDSDIPNVNGMRTDVVEALKEMKIPGTALAGRMLCRRISLDGRYRTESIQKENDQIHTGAALSRTTASEHTSSLNCAVSLAARPMSTATSEAVRFVR